MMHGLPNMLTLAQDGAMEWTRGGWANTTVVHPAGLALLAASTVAMLLVPRRYAVIPIFIMLCFAARQRISLISLDWDFVRIMILVGWARVLLRKETRGFTFHRLDLVAVIWSLTATLGYVVQQASSAALVLRLGATIDTLGAYMLFRVLLRSWSDIVATIRGMAVVAIPVAGAFLIEKSTGRNMFSVVGGVNPVTDVRQGRLRCQGAFAHPILAGSFWASILPLFIALWWGMKERVLCVTGVVATMLIVFACSSSTPVAAVGIAMIGWGVYFVRAYLGYIRWGILAVLVMLQLVMQKPVYHLISRIDLVGGSTGWHRYHLFDQFIRRVDEWFFFGTKSTAHWGYGLFDVTNQYVLEAVRGGIVPLVAFVAMIVIGFRAVGAALRASKGDRAATALAWGIGVSLLTHSVIFFAVSYFGQIVVLWNLSLALTVCAAAASAPATSRARARVGASTRRSGAPRVIGGAIPRPATNARPGARTTPRATERPA